MGKVLIKQSPGSWDQGSLYVGLCRLAGVGRPIGPVIHASSLLIWSSPRSTDELPSLTTSHHLSPRSRCRYDAVFAIRMVLAACLGILCGVTGLTGLQTFVAYLVANFVVPSSWFGYQGITDPAEYDDEKQPINMEGFGQGLSLFVLTWTVSYSLTHG